MLLEREGDSIYDSAIAVANELAALDACGAIVVDDLHFTAIEPTIINVFIDALPEGCRFVAGARSDPPLVLPRLRLRGELVELRGDDLRFAEGELAEFFRLQDIAVEAADLERLHELTEGWPAGAQMASIALRRGVPCADFLRAFSSTDRAVGDFLLSEVLASTPDDLVDFLVETSVLEVFDADLCASVTGVDDAASRLDRLIAANLFVVELDDPPRWFRYHHLFGAFLRARLASLGESRVRSAHERASRSLEARGYVDGALRHAIAAQDVDRVETVLRGAMGRSLSMSDGPEVAVRAVRMWLHDMGSWCVQSDPEWLLEVLIGLISISGPDDAPSWLRRVEDAHPKATGSLRALLEGGWAEHAESRGQVLESIRRFDRAMDAMAGVPPGTGLLALLHVAVARCHVQAGQIDTARRVLQHAQDHPVGHPVADGVRTTGFAAFVAAVDGDLTRAESLARTSTEAADQLELGRHEPGRVYAGLALVETYLERNEAENASDLIDGIKAAADESSRLTVQSTAVLQHAKLARHLGDEVGATSLLTQARLFYVDPDDAVRQVLGEEAVAQALRFEPSRAGDLIGELDPQRVTTQVLRVRRALLDRDHRDAAQLLAELPPATTRRTRVERGVLTALTVLDRDVEGANRHLGVALADAQPEWMIRTIIEHGPQVHKLLLSFAPDAGQATYLAALLDAAGREVAPVRAKAGSPLVDPLSPRELTVLRYLCTRLTYQEIAAALFVSLNTLKSHVRTVYRKLGAASRAEAVDTGRRLGLI